MRSVSWKNLEVWDKCTIIQLNTEISKFKGCQLLLYNLFVTAESGLHQHCNVNSISAVTKAATFLLHSFIWILIKYVLFYIRKRALRKSSFWGTLWQAFFFFFFFRFLSLLRKSKHGCLSDWKTTFLPHSLGSQMLSIRTCFYLSSESFIRKRSRNSWVSKHIQDTAKINHSFSHHTCSGIQQKAEF